MFIFHKARSPTQTLNDLDAYLSGLDDEPIKWLAREVSSWGNEFSYAELEAVIQSGQLDALIDWQGRYATVVNETFAPIWTAAMIAAAAKATRGMIVLSDSNWYVQNWINNRGGELISQLSEESRKAVMNIILRGQELHMAPRDVAKQIRPLIGLNARQAEANVNYRDKVYQQFRDNGLSHTTAAARADKAAIKYAGKQHRYRAETIVLTENAFAYNRGAHLGVSQSIANGYMGRCEMVWTTAGTNRVCSRCLSLKDTVVGHTDESGVTLPPLHPRCRCAIMYREVDTPRVMRTKPRIIIVDYEDVAKVRSQVEFVTFANQIKPVIEQHTGRQSKWNGRIFLENEYDKAGGKNWDCSIRLNPDAPIHALIHELVHSCSISHFGVELFKKFRFEEELAVHYLSQELAIVNNITVASSGYDDGVELIREFKTVLDIKMSDLEFASALVKEDLGYRWEWLAERVPEALSIEATVEQYNYFMNKLEEIRQWGLKQKPSN